MSILETEQISGLVVSIYNIRTWPKHEYYERAKVFPRISNLSGAALESGYGILEDTQALVLLDEQATPLVVEVLNLSKIDIGVRLIIVREMLSGSMKTVLVRES